MQFLRTEGAIFQRATREGEKGYRNWGRGVAWYLLGMIKTLRVLKGAISEPLRNELQQACLAACRMTALLQNNDGLWYAYIDQPVTKQTPLPRPGLRPAWPGVTTKKLWTNPITTAPGKPTRHCCHCSRPMGFSPTSPKLTGAEKHSAKRLPGDFPVRHGPACPAESGAGMAAVARFL